MPSAREAAQDVEALVKLRLMDIIDDNFRVRFRTLQEAADYAGVECIRLYRLRSRRHDQFSIGWLFRLCESAQVPLRIDIKPR